MKTIILTTMLLVLGTIACETNPEDLQTINWDCDRPAEVPDTFADGTSIYWDCSWQSSWLNGDVHMKYDSNGDLKYIYRKVYVPKEK